MNSQIADIDLADLLDHLQARAHFVDAEGRTRPLGGRGDGELLSVERLAQQIGDETLTAAIERARTGERVEDEVILADKCRTVRRVTPARSGEGVVGCLVSYQGRSHTEQRSRSQAAHDLRSPLSVVMMWSKLIRQRDMTDQQRADGLDTVIRNAEILRDLIERHLGRDEKRA